VGLFEPEPHDIMLTSLGFNLHPTRAPAKGSNNILSLVMNLARIGLE